MAHWQPLAPATVIRDGKKLEAMVRYARRISEEHGTAFDEERTRQLMAEEITIPLFKNWQYQVARRETPSDIPRSDGKPGMVNVIHLSIKRLDQKPARDWRDLQRIKNEMIGADCEAVELFPAEDRLVDVANQTHLWGFDDPAVRIPFGFDTRMVDDSADREGVGSKQRKLAT